jgi:hypothetical protein
MRVPSLNGNEFVRNAPDDATTEDAEDAQRELRVRVRREASEDARAAGPRALTAHPGQRTPASAGTRHTTRVRLRFLTEELADLCHEGSHAMTLRLDRAIHQHRIGDGLHRGAGGVGAFSWAGRGEGAAYCPGSNGGQTRGCGAANVVPRLHRQGSRLGCR